jgi:hypothetical protein
MLFFFYYIGIDTRNTRITLKKQKTKNKNKTHDSGCGKTKYTTCVCFEKQSIKITFFFHEYLDGSFTNFAIVCFSQINVPMKGGKKWKQIWMYIIDFIKL